jgi:hypothetical protein
MAMTYSSLLAAKGQAGSIANWVAYSASKLDLATILDEAQALLYLVLRTREMRTVWTFGLAENESAVALPSRFLDPIGRIVATNGLQFIHGIESDIEQARAYEEASGDLGADPFTTVSGSTLVSVTLTDHEFTQGSIFVASGATAVGGLTLNGTFPIVSITSSSVFVIDAGSEASSSATGGGSAVEYDIKKLVAAIPARWSIYDEKLQFDLAASEALQMRLLYYRQPALLSGTNTNNFLTNRYPQLLRQACLVATHDFMQETAASQGALAILQGMVMEVNAKDDLIYRGAEIETEVP